MWETLATICSIFLITVVPAILILWLRDRIRGRRARESDPERQLRLQAWRQRMIHPEIEEVEEFCEGKIPQRLIAMYSDHELILSACFKVCPPGQDPTKNSCCTPPS